MSKIVSRAEAKALGLTRYYTGKLCPYGHDAEKLVSNYTCSVCHRDKVNQYYADNPEIKRNYLKRWNKENPECSQRWIHRNLEKAKEVHKKATKGWRSRNKERYATSWRNYHARKRGASGTRTGEDVLHLFDEQNGECANPRCRSGLTNRFDVDHIVPLVRGGSNGPENLQLLCSPCNGSKGSKTMEEWNYGLASKSPGVWKQALGRAS